MNVRTIGALCALSLMALCEGFMPGVVYVDGRNSSVAGDCDQNRPITIEADNVALRCEDDGRIIVRQSETIQ